MGKLRARIWACATCLRHQQVPWSVYIEEDFGKTVTFIGCSSGSLLHGNLTIEASFFGTPYDKSRVRENQ